MWGQLPSLAMTFKRSIVSSLPTTSSNTCGRYFSTLHFFSSASYTFSNENSTYHGSSYASVDDAPFAAFPLLEEPDAIGASWMVMTVRIRKRVASRSQTIRE
jgi:hypothetical protein